MAGVWVFKNGVMRSRDGHHGEERSGGGGGAGGGHAGKRSVLLHVASGRVVQSHEELERHLRDLGWVRYHPPAAAAAAGRHASSSSSSVQLIQYHRSDGSSDLISLPRRFSDVRSIHMYDIAVKSRFSFLVREE